MAQTYQSQPRYRQKRGHTPLFAPIVMFLAIAALAVAYVGYVLWPRWPSTPVSLDAPAIPIVVAGVMFNIEPAAIRQSVQRRPGNHERIDLAYLWPSLAPPDPAEKLEGGKPADPNERLFVTIVDGADALPPPERVKTIYPRYLVPEPAARPDGLAARAFRDGTPYQGEDLIFDPAAPEQFTLRCSRLGVGNSGVCLDQRRIGNADVTIRFPRDWLADWQNVARGVDRLIARLHPG